MDKLRAELGWFGRIFGAEAHAPLVIAFIVVACGLFTSAALWFLAYKTGVREFWSGEAHISLTAVTTALGYVFGRGSKDSTR
jgi:polyferredoxin